MDLILFFFAFFVHGYIRIYSINTKDHKKQQQQTQIQYRFFVGCRKKLRKLNNKVCKKWRMRRIGVRNMNTNEASGRKEMKSWKNCSIYIYCSFPFKIQSIPLFAMFIL